MQNSNYDAILFDLGGVLVKLGGTSTLQGWTKWEKDEFWRRWLASPTVRCFESGQISVEQFGQELVREFSLQVNADQFLDQFSMWPKGQFPGAENLLDTLSTSFQLGCLSNTNALHWGRLVEEMEFFECFDFTFPSHLTGLLKPDKAAFEHAAAEMALEPGRILFLDDNQINVEGARTAGMIAYTVHGVEGGRALLEQLQIL